MPGDSVSNFLAVSEAHRAAKGVGGSSGDAIAGRARVLAKISEGADSVQDLLRVTELRPEEMEAALRWLAESGLVRMAEDPAAGTERIELPTGVRDVLGG